MQFDRQPSTPWLRMLLKRKNLSSGLEIPLLVAEWTSIAGAHLHSRLAAYRAICGFDESDIPLPYPMVFASALQANVLCDRRFPLPVLGLVHVAQRMTWTCEPARRFELFNSSSTASARLNVSVEGHRQVKRGVEFTLVTELHCEAERIWRAETDILSMAVPGHGRDEEKAKPQTCSASLTQRWDLEPGLGRSYAKIAGDFNPIHMYAWSARLFGFRQAIIHGMWSLAHALAQMPLPVREVNARFVRPVFIPSSPKFELAVLSKEHSSEHQLMLWQDREDEAKLAMWAIALE